MSTRETSNGVSILHRRYVKDDPAKEAALQEERVNAHVARLIRDMRERAELSQKELAELIGTGQSAISRLEDADYEGHSLRMLQKVADALEQRLVVEMTTERNESPTLKFAFHQFVQMLRRAKGLTVDDLALKTGIERDELVALERGDGPPPPPLVLHELSQFYKVPERKMAMLAGAIRDVPEELKQQVSRFAASSESFRKLSREEKRILDEFVAALRAERSP